MIDESTEIWKDVPGYEGLYQISTFGRVKSLPRIKRTKAWQITSERILKPRVSGKEYLSVVLFDKKHEKKQWKVHRLVAIAFLPNPEELLEVNHKDENKGNNRADNLEWCTRSYNVKYGKRIEKQSKRLQKRVIMCGDDGDAILEFESIKSAAQYIGVDPTQISRASNPGNKKTKAGGYLWRRV